MGTPSTPLTVTGYDAVMQLDHWKQVELRLHNDSLARDRITPNIVGLPWLLTVLVTGSNQADILSNY